MTDEFTFSKSKQVRAKRRPKSALRVADALAGKIARAKGKCENCGGTDVLQWAHGISRSYRTIRHDERNGFCLCRACHLHYTHRPLEWDEWLQAKWGQTLYAEMRDRALNGPKADLTATVARLRARVEELDL